MFIFERMWRNKIKTNTKQIAGTESHETVSAIVEDDPVCFSRTLIRELRGATTDEKIRAIFSQSACYMPHEKLAEPKRVYAETKDIEKARKALEDMFKRDIKEYKTLSDAQVEDILNRGWGAAGLFVDGAIIATKIPSQFHEYFATEDPIQKKYYYCHCPRVKKELLEAADLDSIYCNCGGGFYRDIWETITGEAVTITVLNNLFDGDDVCRFRIEFP